MTIIYTADVFCDRCGNWIHGCVSERNTGLARPALKAAKNEGWSRDVKSTYLDLCPKCLIEARKD